MLRKSRFITYPLQGEAGTSRTRRRALRTSALTAETGENRRNVWIWWSDPTGGFPPPELRRASYSCNAHGEKDLSLSLSLSVVLVHHRPSPDSAHTHTHIHALTHGRGCCTCALSFPSSEQWDGGREEKQGGGATFQQTARSSIKAATLNCS